MSQKNSISIFVLLMSMSFMMNKPRTETGTASYYHDKFHGRKTYSGEVYDKHKMTGAHTTLPMGTMVKLTNLKNDSTVILKINDRLPSKKRIVDVSRAGAEQLNFIRDGLVKVRLEIIEKEEI